MSLDVPTLQPGQAVPASRTQQPGAAVGGTPSPGAAPVFQPTTKTITRDGPPGSSPVLGSSVSLTPIGAAVAGAGLGYVGAAFLSLRSRMLYALGGAALGYAYVSIGGASSTT